MAGIASKNLYDLLGNTEDQDPDREPSPPTKAIDKPTARKGKRDAAGDAPANTRGGAGRSGGTPAGDKATRDHPNNRGMEDGFRQERHPDRAGRGESRGRGRGGRGGRGGGGRDDRHSRTGISDNDKQAAHGWGGQSGGDEWADEKAGEAIAKDEENSGFDNNNSWPAATDGEGFVPDNEGFAADNEGFVADSEGFVADGGFVADNSGFVADNSGAGEAPAGKFDEVEEDKSKSYATYMAELAEKKLQLGGALATRKPNEGSAKKFPEGKAITRADEEESYMAGTGGKAARLREKKTKEVVQLNDEDLFKAPDIGGRGGGRGGRGRGRGDGFRGDHRGGEGRPRGGGRGRGGDRDRERGGDFGGRGRGPRAGRAGFQAHADVNVNVNDQSAFPSLGS